MRYVNMADAGTPKIIVDDDWKSQARAEKEKLAAAEKQRASEKQASVGGAGGPGVGADGGEGDPGHGRLPPADFSTLLGSMITQALMYMGAFPDPETGQAVVSLEHAKFHIDLLGVLEQKTKGNLSEAESKDVSQSLNQLRLQFVEITKAVAQYAEKRQAGKGGAPGGMPGHLGGM